MSNDPHVRVTPVARAVPHEPIEGLEVSYETQTALNAIFHLFRSVMKEPTGFVNKYSDSVLTFTDATRTISIAPTGASFDYYIRGKVYTVSSPQSCQIPAVANEGLWFMYFDATGACVVSQTPWDLTAAVAPIATGYWDSTNAKWIRKNEERHGVTMDFDTHRLLHRAEGAKVDIQTVGSLTIGNYVTDGDGSLNSHAQYSVSNGTYFDEDLALDIKHAAVPANPFEQFLTPTAKIPVFYLSGADSWRMKTADTYPIFQNPPGTCYYNRLNAGTWNLQPCTNGYYFATWLVYTDDLSEPVITILGQRQDVDLISAINLNTRSGLILPRRFSEEMYFYRKIVWQTDTTYANTPKARIRYVATTVEITPSNDRYSVICSYNGNAGTGKFLEWYPGQTSDTSPFPIPESSYIRTVTLSTTAASTGTLSFYKSTDLATSILDVSLSASVYTKVNAAIPLLADDKLVTKVSAGSFNKPALTMFVQTSL